MHSHAEKHGCLSKSHGASSMGYFPFLSETPPLTPPTLKKNQTEKEESKLSRAAWKFPQEPDSHSHAEQ